MDIFDLFETEKKKKLVTGYQRENGVLVPLRYTETQQQGVETRPVEVFEDLPQRPKGKAKKPSTRRIQVFDVKSVASARERVKRSETEQKRRLMPEVEFAEKNGGMREIPKLGKLPKVLENLNTMFPNFSDAISAIGEDFALAAASRPADFRISPMLLDGVPGIGKTAFAQKLAADFGLPFLNINAAGLQHSASIVGAATHWASTAPGDVFSLLAEGESATGVVLLDEVDKLQALSEYGVLPALLQLLEPESARVFKDVSINVVFDASHLIILMTSNVRNRVDGALLSRARVFEVEEPRFEQRVAIMQRWLQALQKQNRSRVKPTLAREEIERLADLSLDLRALHRTIKSSYGRALLEQSETLEIKWDSLEKQQQKRRPIGFAQ